MPYKIVLSQKKSYRFGKIFLPKISSRVRLDLVVVLFPVKVFLVFVEVLEQHEKLNQKR
ncbi:hypothetical protein SGGBAA2069_c15090 [Streptococcus gallolyticus subsp. gallolyticus ATCC BAA-2069]|uniref:Uncharacterized protein n=1 Tax=Streptococcus gallolyticus TaxID=315405 RepID=A0A139R5Y5_9STRE|nr:hypothetical protein SGADD03_00306 [Streptococcus gallolyticus]CBZ48681.1 hypothetical protein SGGBAA2069_c15090 [Streptococcus gallolyticus subsp. gallolyticus ATCC BAA-2069]